MILTLTWEFLARTLIVTSFLLFTLARIVADYHPYFDQTSHFLFLVLSILLFVANGRLSTSFPFFRLIGFVIFAFINVRLVFVAFFPDWLFLADRVTPELMSKMLVYVILGSLACFVGCGWACLVTPKARPKSAPVVEAGPFAAIAILATFSSLLLLFNEFVFGFSGSSGSGQHLNFFSRYVIRLFQPLILFIVTAVGYRLLRVKSSNSKRLMLLATLSILLQMVVTGSRAAIYECIVVYIAMIPTTQKEFILRISVPRAIALIAVLLLAPVFFGLATNLRTNRYEAKTTFFYQIDSQSLIWQAISRRLSLVESTMFPLFHDSMGFYNIEELVNPETTALSTLNRLIPGKLFGDILYSEFAWCYFIHKKGCFAYDSLDRADRVGYEWGMFGIGYQLFGYVGGLLFIFCFTFVISFVFQSLHYWNTWASLSGYCLGGYALQFWVKNLGVDNWIDRFSHSFFLLFLYFTFLSWVTRSRTKQRHWNDYSPVPA